MKERVYIETSIVSYLTARPSRNNLIKSHQELTHRWWKNHAPNFDLCTSQFVIDEAASGNKGMAAARSAVLEGIESLSVNSEVGKLADRLIVDGALPLKARVDALHLAVATTNGAPYP